MKKNVQYNFMIYYSRPEYKHGTLVDRLLFICRRLFRRHLKPHITVAVDTATKHTRSRIQLPIIRRLFRFVSQTLYAVQLHLMVCIILTVCVFFHSGVTVGASLNTKRIVIATFFNFISNITK